MRDYVDQYKKFYQGKGYKDNAPVIAAKDVIRHYIKKTGSESLVDFGCGLCLHYDKNRLQDYWGIKDENLYRYDPAIPKYETKPTEVHDAVINTDVLEHIPEFDLDSVLTDIFSLAKKLVYIRIATSKAMARLPNGENAHCTLKTHKQWVDLIKPYKRDGQLVVVECWGKSKGKTEF